MGGGGHLLLLFFILFFCLWSRTNKQVKQVVRGRMMVTRRTNGASTLMWHFRRCWLLLLLAQTPRIFSLQPSPRKNRRKRRKNLWSEIHDAQHFQVSLQQVLRAWQVVTRALHKKKNSDGCFLFFFFAFLFIYSVAPISHNNNNNKTCDEKTFIIISRYQTMRAILLRFNKKMKRFVLNFRSTALPQYSWQEEQKGGDEKQDAASFFFLSSSSSFYSGFSRCS